MSNLPLIPDTASIRDALANLTQTGLGLVCIIDDSKRVVGVVSDGDVRNALLKGSKADARVLVAMNRDFVSMRKGASREQVLKLLDSRIKVAPVLNDNGQFVCMSTRDYASADVSVYARAKSPVRLSLAGGGTDISRHFIKNDAVCLSATMARYSHVTLKRRNDLIVKFISHDLKQFVELDSLAQVEYDGKLDLLKAGARIMKPKYGFELTTMCDFQPGSGLGGSAALLSSIIACFNEFRAEKLGPYEIAEHAFEAERIELDIPGGWQDQYATVFGGVNFLQLSLERNLVMPLRINKATLCELEERLLICHASPQHLGSAVHEQLSERSQTKEYLAFSEGVSNIAKSMRDDLLRGNLKDFGRLLHKTWVLKREHSPGASSDSLDAIYDLALANGAQGGRLLGTGGGGFFLFFVEPFRWHELAEVLRATGLKVDNVVLDHEGLRTWICRE